MSEELSNSPSEHYPNRPNLRLIVFLVIIVSVTSSLYAFRGRPPQPIDSLAVPITTQSNGIPGFMVDPFVLVPVPTPPVILAEGLSADLIPDASAEISSSSKIFNSNSNTEDSIVGFTSEKSFEELVTSYDNLLIADGWEVLEREVLPGHATLYARRSSPIPEDLIITIMKLADKPKSRILLVRKVPRL